MSRLPTGTVTFLFTDIEGSTALWERDREAMAAALARHDTLMRQAVAQQGGLVFKTIGDAFCAVFERPAAGLAAAVAAQRTLAAADWRELGDAAPLRVRMGLHPGQAEERDGDYFGPPVNRVARIQAAGHGGQILLSAVMRSAVEAAGLPSGLSLRDLGEHRLKDLRHSERIAQVVAPGLVDVTRAPRTAGVLAARDRIRVLDATDAVDPLAPTVVARTVPDTLMAIEVAVHRDTAGALLTAEQVLAAARHKPSDWREFRLGRIAEWSQPRYRLDGRFIDLTLLVDQGEDAVRDRWAEQEGRYDSLNALLAAVVDPAMVVLGSPGSGKSTLLRHFELDLAIGGLKGAASGDGAGERVTFFVSLSAFAPDDPGQPPPSPSKWLAAAWQKRYPALPPLDDLLASGRVTLLLDALNEMPAPNERERRARLQLWKVWLQDLVATHPGNRILFSCRSLDYSQPLSTPDLRVPQVRIEPLSDAQAKDFLTLYSPGRWREVWAALEGSPQLEVLRSPYFLALLVEQVEGSGEMPKGRAALFTGFVRQALRREVERGNLLFESASVLDGRDLRRIAKWQWQGPYDLPVRGPLIPKLSRLAHAMQEAREDGGGSQVRVDFDDALAMLDSGADETIVSAGEALAILDEDEAAAELMYTHQLVQEYFAGRELAKRPNPDLVRTEWLAERISPSVADVVAGLSPGDTLPPLPGTGWEETTQLAAAMAEDPERFLRGVMATNLVTAGRAAAQTELRGRLSAGFLNELRWALVARSRETAADLRERIASGFALGDLGDPRFERHTGPCGEYLMPPFVDIPGGMYWIGDDEPLVWSTVGATGVETSHMPRHRVSLSAFRIGQFPVTNAEWACFMESGGYEQDLWWDTDDGWRWRRGDLPDEAGKDSFRMHRRRMQADPTLFEQMLEAGRFPTAKAAELWRGWLQLDQEAFDAAMSAYWQVNRKTEPSYWQDKRYNNPAQPIVGVGWYEARAYCRWLAAQTGSTVRLPTEAEWEATAGGLAGKRYPWGGQWKPFVANVEEIHLKRTSPVGVFVTGDSPQGVADLLGNVCEWTSSLYGKAMDEEDLPTFAYPYDPTDGREDERAPSNIRRIVRGGTWLDDQTYARATARVMAYPDLRIFNLGLRVVSVPR